MPKDETYAADSLRIESGETTVEDIHDFLLGRIKSPIKYEAHGVTVWNFSSHRVKRDELDKKVRTLSQSEYIIPYQVPGAWGYMVSVLPKNLQEAELLVWSMKDSRYKAYTNFRRVSTRHEDTSFAREAREAYREVKWGNGYGG